VKTIIAIVLFLICNTAFSQQFGVGYSVGSHNEFNAHLKTSEKISVLASANPDRGSVDVLYQQSSYLSYGIGVNGIRSQQFETATNYLWHPPSGKGKKAKPGFWEVATSQTEGAEQMSLGLRMPIMLHYTIPDYPVKLFTVGVPVMSFDDRDITVEASAGILYYFGQ
jgi:hypothetical protein